jgi:hypothetical protein
MGEISFLSREVLESSRIASSHQDITASPPIEDGPEGPIIGLKERGKLFFE